MRMLRAWKFLLCLVLCAMAAQLVYADPPCCCDPDGVQSSGAVYRICMPPPGKWNGGLVVYAHGYVAFNEPIAIPEDQLSFEGTSVPGIVTSLGYAFATTGYSENGLAIQAGLSDVLDLVQIFADTYGTPRPVYIVGVSEGGLVATLALEQHPDVFDGGTCACGPIGDFNIQIGWFGDFRALFDYYFPDLLPGNPEGVPPEFIDTWYTYYSDTLRPVLYARKNASRFRSLLAAARVPFDLTDRTNTIENSLKDLLWYNVFGTNDAVSKLGGPPYDNQGKRYTGVLGAWALNRDIHRYAGSPIAAATLADTLQTTGNLKVPLVTIHTLWDPQVPYRHMPLYTLKTIRAGAATEHINIPIARYDHCAFTEQEVLVAFALMVLRVEGPEAVISLAFDKQLPNGSAKKAYRNLATQYGVPLSP